MLANEKGYRFRDRITVKTGRLRIGNKFNIKSLHHILTNKTYLGLIENKRINEIYKGIHEAIITEEQFNKVREILDKNRNDKIYRSKRKVVIKDTDSERVVVKYNPNRNTNVPYLLKGLVRCKCCNSLLTPTYTTKLNRVYRYYKSNKSIKYKSKCTLDFVPAEEIESVVLNEIYKIIKTPKVIANTIRLSNNLMDSTDIVSSFHNIETIWKELYPKEQMEIVNNVIEEITVERNNLTIRFKLKGFIYLLNETQLNNINIQDNNKNTEVIQINIPINFFKRGGRSYIMIPKDKIDDDNLIIIDNPAYKYNNVKRDTSKVALVKALLLALKYKNKINNNNISSLRELTTFERKSLSYLCDIYNLNYLSPDIKKRILNGDIPKGLTLQEIKNKAIPIDWNEQRRLYGFN